MRNNPSNDQTKSETTVLWSKPWLTKRELAQYTGFSPRFIDQRASIHFGLQAESRIRH